MPKLMKIDVARQKRNRRYLETLEDRDVRRSTIYMPVKYLSQLKTFATLLLNGSTAEIAFQYAFNSDGHEHRQFVDTVSRKKSRRGNIAGADRARRKSNQKHRDRLKARGLDAVTVSTPNGSFFRLKAFATLLFDGLSPEQAFYKAFSGDPAADSRSTKDETA